MKWLLSCNPFDCPNDAACPGNTAQAVCVDVESNPQFTNRQDWLAIKTTNTKELVILLNEVGVCDGSLAAPVIGQNVRNRHTRVMMHGPNHPFVIHSVAVLNIKQADLLVNTPMHEGGCL